MPVDVNETLPAAGGAASQKNQEPEESFESLLQAYENRTQSFSEGEVIRGRVIALSGAGVVVDVGFKSEGIIPLEQFSDDQGKTSVKVGDVVVQVMGDEYL